MLYEVYEWYLIWGDEKLSGSDVRFRFFSNKWRGQMKKFASFDVEEWLSWRSEVEG